MKYIVIWKDGEGQQVSTVVDANNEPMRYDDDYLESNAIRPIYDEQRVLDVLATADGEKIAVPPEVVRSTVGWDV